MTVIIEDRYYEPVGTAKPKIRNMYAVEGQSSLNISAAISNISNAINLQFKSKRESLDNANADIRRWLCSMGTFSRYVMFTNTPQ